MSGECKSYRLNKPMTWAEFKAMPNDIQITYVKLLRQKFDVPDAKLAEMFGTSKDGISFRFKKLGLNEGKTRKRKNWDKEGFYAWWHGVDKLPTPVPEEPTEEPVIEEVPIEEPIQEEPEVFVEDDLPFDIVPVKEPDPVFPKPSELHYALCAEIDELRKRGDELLKSNEELMAVHEKDKQEITYLRNKCDNYHMNARILEAQMDVVRLIFGGKNHG